VKRTDPFSGRARIRSCALVVREKKLLLVKQNAPTRPEPIWLPPGGEVLFSESLEKAALREVEEETGMQISVSHLAAVHEFIEQPYHAVEFYFAASVTGGNLITGSDPELNDDEQQIMECAFLPLDELKKLPVYPDFLSEESFPMMVNKPQKGTNFFRTGK